MRQLLNGMNGPGADLVSASNAMLAQQNTIQDTRWPYWWKKERVNTTPVPRCISVPAPAPGVVTEVCKVVVPSGFIFVLWAIRQTFQTSISPSPFVEGSGDILWTVDVNIPVGSVASAGYGIPDLTLTTDERGSKLGPWEIKGYNVFKEFDEIRYKVVTTNNIPPGSPSFITCGLFGWFDKAR